MRTSITCIQKKRKLLLIISMFSALLSFEKLQAQIQFSASVDTGCAPLNVQFTSILSLPLYMWDFGDGATSVLQNPSHVYMNPGSYTVKLLTTGLTGLTDSLVRADFITVLNNPVANFQAANATICQNSAIAGFVNASQNASTYIWDFGDGNTSTQANPSHLYANGGSYTVQLIAKNNLGCSDIKVVTNAISVLPQPTVAFLASSTTLCLPANQTTFTNLTPACVYQKWDFGDGTSSLAANPTHTYTMPGNYSISLIAKNSSGCQDTLTKTSYIAVVPMSSSTISTNVNTGCIPLTVNFSTANATSYLWDFGDGTTSTSASPSYTYTSSGQYDISVTLTKPNGCVETTRSNGLINIPDPAVALFSINNTSGCAPLICSFANLSQNAVSYIWNFGDGHYSTAIHPGNTYTTNATQQVTLKAYNSAGCLSTYTHTTSVVSSKPRSNFTTPGQVNCAPFTITFNNTSNAGAATYLWDFGDGNTSALTHPTHTYINPGNFTVKLISFNANGCSDTLTRLNYITVINPTVNYTSLDTLSGCVPFSVSLTDSTFGASSWLWDFGDGAQSTLRNPTHIYTEGGEYIITLNLGLTGGCTQVYSNFKRVQVNEVNAGFIFTHNCLTNTVSFTDTTANIASNTWNFYQGHTSTLLNPTHTYPATGIYNITLSVTNTMGCTEMLSYINLLNLQPCSTGEVSGEGTPPVGNGEGGSSVGGPAVTPSGSNQISGCAPLHVNFSYPFSAGHPIVWIFGDNTSSTETNPTHTYSENGIYSVMLVYQNAAGLVDTITYTNLISINSPQALFTSSLSSNCIQYTVSTTNNSVNANQFIWNFGDGTTSGSFNPAHSYTGNQLDYTISLQAIDTVTGCSSVQSGTLFLSNNNLIWADKYETCVQQAVNFYFSSASYVNYTWNFGDGSSSTQQNPSHSYTSSGSYSITLLVEDAFGCTRLFSLPQPINIYNPLADFTYTRSGSCSSYQMSFTNLSSPLNLGTNGYCLWNFGDGTTSSQYLPAVIHAYTNPGTYQVTLKVATNGGCVNVITKTVEVNRLEADFVMQQNRDCFPMTVSFVDETTHAISWEWDFGNGITSALQNPSVMYTQLPADSIRLIVTDYRGCKDTAYKREFNLFANTINLSSDSICVNAALTFNGVQDSVSVHWNFGDGVTSSLLSPSHTYTTQNSFNVTLTSTDVDGCSYTDSALVTTGMSIPGFNSPDTIGCAPLFVSFTNTTTGGQSFIWDFGDGSASISTNPSHIYNTPGTYTVKLISLNATGCSDTLVLTNYIKIIGPIVSFALANDTICESADIDLLITSSNVDSWQWNFGDGANSNEASPSHIYTVPGHYQLSLIAHDTHGCSAFYIDSSLYVSGNPVANYTNDTMISCTPTSVHFNNHSTGATHYVWNFGNGSTANTSQAPVPVYNNPGIYNTSLIAYNNAGCSDTAFIGLEIFQKPSASFYATQQSGCAGSMFELINTSSDTISPNCTWLIQGGLHSTSYNTLLPLSSSGSHHVTLIVTNSNGCSDTLIKQNYITVADSIPPAINPIQVVSVTSDTSVFIKWEEATCTDFQAYVLYRKNNSTGVFLPIDTIENKSLTNYTDAGLHTLQHSYFYKLQTIDICDNRTELDALTAHRTIEIRAVVLADNTIAVNWNSYGGCNISGYKVERAENNTTTYSEIAIVAPEHPYYIDSSAYCPIKFTYRVTALDVCGSVEVSLSDTSAARPANIFKDQKTDIVRSTVINNKSILTEWAMPAIMPNAVSSFKLFRKENNHSYAFIANVPGNQTSYIDNNVNVDSAVYEYKIFTVNYCNLSSGEGTAGISVLLEVSQKELSTDLKWSPYTKWDSGVDYYIIERKNEEGEWEQIRTVEGDVINVTIEEE